MPGTGRPTVLLLDGTHDSTLQIAKELSRDLDCRVIGAGASRYSRLFYSRYCDACAVLPDPSADGYARAVMALACGRRPDVVVPVGAASVAAVDAVRDGLPGGVAAAVPPSESLGTALDKRRTLALAQRQGIPVPPDLTDRVAAIDRRGRDPEAVDRLPFPLFLKARRETGAPTTARVSSPDALWEAYDALRREVDGDEVVVQEWVGGAGPTYGCGALFTDEGLALTFGHVERRSVPPRGGSGTRLATHADPDLAATATDLLAALDWRGVALVEFKRVDGRYVLMEINPKFWASYALASQCGHRFASALVADRLDRSPPSDTAHESTDCERVFPLRELAHWATERHAPLAEVLRAMTVPPARPAANPEDPIAPLVPPLEVVRARPSVRATLRAVARLSPFGPRPGEVTRVRPDTVEPS